MAEQITIDAELLSSLINLADYYHKELDYWYGLAEAGDGGSANSYSATSYYNYGGEFGHGGIEGSDDDDRIYNEALNQFKNDLESAKTVVRNATEVLRPRDKVIRELKEKIQKAKEPEILHKLGSELAGLFEGNDDGFL